MSLITNWGYILEGVDTLPDILTLEEFNTLTAEKYSGDMRIPANISAACSAVRDYCSWHVFPALPCVLDTTFFNDSVTCTGKRCVLIQLPARYVAAVESVTINGHEYDTFVAEPNGLVKVYKADISSLCEYSPVKVEYTAGFPDALTGALKELIAYRVTHALASSSGVQSETAGGVSITYSANWINSARSTALPNDNKDVLAPYKVQGVF